MNPPGPYQQYIIWALGAAFFSICALVGSIFRTINKAGADAKTLAAEVRAELLRAEARTEKRLDEMHAENRARYAESRVDRDAMQQVIRDNHDTDLAQHAQMIQSIAELPMRVSEMLRHDAA